MRKKETRIRYDLVNVKKIAYLAKHKKGMNVSRLARLSDMGSTAFYSKLNTQKFYIDELKRIAEVLEVSMLSLFHQSELLAHTKYQDLVEKRRTL